MTQRVVAWTLPNPPPPPRDLIGRTFRVWAERGSPTCQSGACWLNFTLTATSGRHYDALLKMSPLFSTAGLWIFLENYLIDISSILCEIARVKYFSDFTWRLQIVVELFKLASLKRKALPTTETASLSSLFAQRKTGNKRDQTMQLHIRSCMKRFVKGFILSAVK